MCLLMGIVKYVLICSLVLSIALNFIQLAIPGMNRTNPLMKIVRPCVDELCNRFCACGLLQRRAIVQQQQQRLQQQNLNPFTQQQQSSSSSYDYQYQQQFAPQASYLQQQQPQQQLYTQQIQIQPVLHTQCCLRTRNFIAEVFACESIPQTLAVIIGLQIGQFVVGHLSYSAIMTLCFLALFTLPKMYELHQGAFNHFIDYWENRVNTVFFRVKRQTDQIAQDTQQTVQQVKQGIQNMQQDLQDPAQYQQRQQLRQQEIRQDDTTYYRQQQQGGYVQPQQTYVREQQTFSYQQPQMRSPYQNQPFDDTGLAPQRVQ
jgi:hypothetical protein